MLRAHRPAPVLPPHRATTARSRRRLATEPPRRPPLDDIRAAAPSTDASPRRRLTAGSVAGHGATDLRPRERVRRHLHAPRPAPAQPRRGRPLPVPPGRVVGPQLQRLPRQRRPALPRRRLATPSTPPRSATRIHDLVVARQGGGADPRAAARLAPSSASREEGIRGDIYLFKNNTDSAGNSYGCHENYLTSRRDDFGHYAEVLIPFLVSRQIYAGAGKVLQTARGAHVLHQPAGRAHLGGRLVGHHPLAARSSTPATSRTPTPSATAAST